MMSQNPDIALLKQQARECLQRQDLAGAQALLLQASSRPDADAETWLLLGVSRGMAGDAAAAEQAFQRAIALQPDYAQAYYNLGRALRDQGKYQAAVDALRQAARGAPGNPAVMIALADALAQNSEISEARRLCEQVLRAAPGHPEALVCQGNLLHRDGRLDEACNCYDRALAHPAAPLAARVNKGLVRMAQGRMDEALDDLETALAAGADSSEVHCAIGTLHMHKGARDRAEQSLRRAFELSPRDVAIGMQLAAALRFQNRMEDAATVYQQLLSIDPGNESARFYLDAIREHRDQPSRVPGAVVRTVYDREGGGANFDASLTNQLQYKGPELLDQAVRQALGPDAGGLRILELGCGTGLCGGRLRNLATHMVGVDLSSEMIECARRKHIYDLTLIEDLHEVLDRSESEYDLVIGMDVLCYFGDLTEVVGKCARALRPGGLLGFSVEKADPGKPWQFHHYGHFLHSLEHIRSVAASTGLAEVSSTEATLRVEMCEARIGYVCLLRKPA